jgi:hypothetical protein
MNFEETNRIIRRSFRIKDNDIPPLTNHRYISNRIHLAKVFRELGFKIGAEIGVDKGRHTELLFKTIKDLKLYCIDPYKSYDAKNHITKQEAMDRNFESAWDRNKGRNIEWWKMESTEAVNDIEDYSLDFVYIDAGFMFDDVMNDIILWSKKVRPNGIVSGRNYISFYRSGAIMAVNTYTRAHNISEWYVTSIRSKGDPHASWFWVKKDKDWDIYG